LISGTGSATQVCREVVLMAKAVPVKCRQMEKESHALYLDNQNRTIPHYHPLQQLLIAFGVPAAPAVDMNCI